MAPPTSLQLALFVRGQPDEAILSYKTHTSYQAIISFQSRTTFGKSKDAPQQPPSDKGKGKGAACEPITSSTESGFTTTGKGKGKAVDAFEPFTTSTESGFTTADKGKGKAMVAKPVDADNKASNIILSFGSIKFGMNVQNPDGSTKPREYKPFQQHEEILAKVTFTTEAQHGSLIALNRENLVNYADTDEPISVDPIDSLDKLKGYVQVFPHLNSQYFKDLWNNLGDTPLNIVRVQYDGQYQCSSNILVPEAIGKTPVMPHLRDAITKRHEINILVCGEYTTQGFELSSFTRSQISINSPIFSNDPMADATDRSRRLRIEAHLEEIAKLEAAFEEKQKTIDKKTAERDATIKSHPANNPNLDAAKVFHYYKELQDTAEELSGKLDELFPKVRKAFSASKAAVDKECNKVLGHASELNREFGDTGGWIHIGPK